MSAQVAGRVILITGARQGIGRTYALRMAEAGATVVICDLEDPLTVATAIRAAGGEVLSAAADVTSLAAMRELVERAVNAYGKIDALVNNAAFFTALQARPFEEIASEEWDRVMAVNTRGIFECTRAVLPIMRRQHYGKIVNISSGTAFKGTTGLLHYVASKGAVIAMSRALARELGPDNICVNTIAPGNTPVEGGATSARSLATIATRALQRAETPADIVGAVMFFCSADSDFITGQTLVVDGGSVFN